jgi:hypothetical protein
MCECAICATMRPSSSCSSASLKASLEIGKKHALFVVHVLQVMGDEEGEPAIKAGEQHRALVIGRHSNAFE